jgi:uncharacterized repeat protein (TIGR04138 family)
VEQNRDNGCIRILDFGFWIGRHKGAGGVTTTKYMGKVKKNLQEIAAADGRYCPEALEFVHEGLGHTVRMLGKSEDETEKRHISGADLADGLRTLAIEKWGRLAKSVLNKWGVRTTRDFGEIVYLMIEYEWMSAQPSDTIDDFNNLYDFKSALEDAYQVTTDLK